MTYLDHDLKPVWSTWELENIYEWMSDLVKGGLNFTNVVQSCTSESSPNLPGPTLGPWKL